MDPSFPTITLGVYDGTVASFFNIRLDAYIHIPPSFSTAITLKMCQWTSRELSGRMRVSQHSMASCKEQAYTAARLSHEHEHDTASQMANCITPSATLRSAGGVAYPIRCVLLAIQLFGSIYSTRLEGHDCAHILLQHRCNCLHMDMELVSARLESRSLTRRGPCGYHLRCKEHSQMRCKVWKTKLWREPETYHQ